MKKGLDAFGQSLWDAHCGGSALHVIEREDGLLDVFDPAGYFRGAGRWAKHERKMMGMARGRVLDIGCGAGRHALMLRKKGVWVLGIDESPMMIKTARARGVKRTRVMGIEEVSGRLGRFDTILMMGNNFGLFGNARRAKVLLRRFLGMTAEGAIMIVESNDVYQTTKKVHLDYQRENRRRGRMAGQIRMRVRYREMATGYFDYLMVSLEEMKGIVEGTGWKVGWVVRSGGSSYIAVLEKV